MKHCITCGTNYEGEICPGCVELSNKQKLKNRIILIVVLSISIIAIIVCVLTAEPIPERCAYCTNEPEYTIGRTYLCEKHYLESLAHNLK